MPRAFLAANLLGGNANMGKYLIAWILGIPAFVLVIIYLLFN